VEVVASLSQGRTTAAQCGLFTYKSAPVIFEPPCNCPAVRGSSFREMAIEPSAGVLIILLPGKLDVRWGSVKREATKDNFTALRGSGMEGKKNNFWRRRQRKNDTLRIDDRGRRGGI